MTHPLNALSFPLHGPRLIEASAGTGKTYTIAALYLRLILGHGGTNAFPRPLTPPEILVVTFTNAATEELRNRIRLRLTEAAACFRRQCEGDDYLQQLREEYEQERWPAQARLLEQAAQWMDESAIHTIHAWCQRILRQHAFDSGTLFDMNLETDESPLYEEAACDYWRRRFYPLTVQQLVLLTRMIRCDDPFELLGKVRPLLDASGFDVAPDWDRDVLKILDERCRLLETARQRWAADFENAVSQLRTARKNKILNGNQYRANSLEKWIDHLTCWVNGQVFLPDEQVVDKFSASGLSAGTNKGKTAPTHPAYDAFEQFRTHVQGVRLEAVVIGQAAGEIGHRVRQEKHRRAQMGFDDLLGRVYEALHQPGNTRLAQVIREQFPVAMIDEFQDTDPIQYAAFHKIYSDTEALPSPCSLIMIGDPKQAIYGFRGADIHTYLSARAHSDESYTLDKNYRSATGMVAAVNTIFKAGSHHSEGAFLFKDRITFEPVAAHGRAEALTVQGKPATAMNFWVLPQTGPVPKSGDDGYIRRMAEGTAGEIARLLNLAESKPPQAGFGEAGQISTPLGPADIAVLVRDKNEAAVMRAALQAHNVGSVYLSEKQSVFDTDEAQSLLYLLRACAEPENAQFIKTALACDIPALPLTQLDALNHDESVWEAQVDRFGRFRRIWRRQGVLPLLRELLLVFKVPSRLLNMPGGERRLTNLLHLAELLQNASAELDGPQALIRWLAGQCRQPDGSSDDQILRLESDDDLVRVITIHKSKGLEYSLVFLPFICTYRKVDQKVRPVKYHDARGRLIQVGDPGEADIRAADKERLAEDLRLLYVALTRAVHACWLGIGVMQRNALHYSAIGYLLSDGQPIAAENLNDFLRDLKGDCAHIAVSSLPKTGGFARQPGLKAEKRLPARLFQGDIPRNWWISSYSGILSQSGWPELMPAPLITGEPALSFPDSAVEDQLQEACTRPEAIGHYGQEALRAPRIAGRTIHTFPRGPEAGTFLHNLLEGAAEEGFAVLSRCPKRMDKIVARHCARRGWEDWAETLADWLRQLLQAPLVLPQDLGQVVLSGLSPENCQAEMEFLFAAHQVSPRILDELISKAVLPGARRPPLRGNRLNGMLKGFIDLVFCHRQRYYVLDYKSNHLGEDGSAYGMQAMQAAMLEHRYDLQYVLYTLALHRLLKARLADYHYEKDVGGVLYVFLRGVNARGEGVYAHKPSVKLIETLDDCFSGQELPDAD